MLWADPLSAAFGIEELARSRDPDASKPPELAQVVVAGEDCVGRLLATRPGKACPRSTIGCDSA
jgi:hypothetical protein